jgi:hypothetical protein
MNAPLMPKATAVWLIENTALTFDQISEFCKIHILEVQAIADGEVNSAIVGSSPVMNGQLTYDEIKRCEDDQSASLKLIKSDLPEVSFKTKGPKYIPLSRRGDKPNAIAWIVKYHPELKDSQIVRLIGTTKNTIEKIRDRTHWNILNITAKHPVLLELCSYEDLNKAIVKSGGDPTASEVQVNTISELP